MLPNRKFQLPARGAQQDENAMPATTAAKKGVPPALAAFKLSITPSITKPISTSTLPVNRTAAIPAKPATRRASAFGAAAATCPVGPAPAIPAFASTAPSKVEDPRKRTSDRELKYTTTAVPAAAAPPASPQYQEPAAKRVRPNSRKAQKAAAAAAPKTQAPPEMPVSAPCAVVRAPAPRITAEIVRAKRLALLDVGMEEPDLDVGEVYNPVGCSEYVSEIIDNLMVRENDFMPDANYLVRQPDFESWDVRAISVDWMMQVHTQMHMMPETLHLAVNLFDRFLSKRQVSKLKLQLAALTVLFMAAKIEEVETPYVAAMLDHFPTVTAHDLVRAEQHVLRALDFDVWAPGPLQFLRRVSVADGFDVEHRSAAKILVDVALLDHRLLAYPPSQVAAACLWLARKVVSGVDDWDAIYRYASAYHIDELRPVVKALLGCVSAMNETVLVGFATKYLSPAYANAETIAMAQAVLRRARREWDAATRPN
ncbi:G2/mitotic-specific cyclin [Allomyces arbusculus]|nr:G2/mitotic-specific cyclin [Allomyces arbusculus]